MRTTCRLAGVLACVLALGACHLRVPHAPTSWVRSPDGSRVAIVVHSFPMYFEDRNPSTGLNTRTYTIYVLNEPATVESLRFARPVWKHAESPPKYVFWRSDSTLEVLINSSEYDQGRSIVERDTGDLQIVTRKLRPARKDELCDLDQFEVLDAD